MPASMYRNYFAKTFEKNSNLTEIKKTNADLKHTVRPKVCGHLTTTFTYVLVEHIPEYSIFCLRVAVIITSALLRRLSARRRRGIRVHSATRAFVRSDTDVGRGELGCSRCLNASQKVFTGVEARALFRPLESFHSSLSRPRVPGPRFVHRHAGTCLSLLVPLKGNHNAGAFKKRKTF